MRRYIGVPLGGGVYGVRAWIPNKGRVMYYKLTHKELIELHKISANK